MPKPIRFLSPDGADGNGTATTSTDSATVDNGGGAPEAGNLSQEEFIKQQLEAGKEKPSGDKGKSKFDQIQEDLRKMRNEAKAMEQKHLEEIERLKSEYDMRLHDETRHAEKRSRSEIEPQLGEYQNALRGLKEEVETLKVSLEREKESKNEKSKIEAIYTHFDLASARGQSAQKAIRTLVAPLLAITDSGEVVPKDPSLSLTSLAEKFREEYAYMYEGKLRGNGMPHPAGQMGADPNYKPSAKQGLDALMKEYHKR